MSAVTEPHGSPASPTPPISVATSQSASSKSSAVQPSSAARVTRHERSVATKCVVPSRIVTTSDAASAAGPESLRAEIAMTLSPRRSWLATSAETTDHHSSPRNTASPLMNASK